MASAVLAVVADLAMQYTNVDAHVGSPAYANLLDVSTRNLLVGHFLGIAAVLALRGVLLPCALNLGNVILFGVCLAVRQRSGDSVPGEPL